MTEVKKLKEIYKCNICGNVVEVTKVGSGELVCCGAPMELLEEKTQDEGKEKHVPIIEKTESGYKVKVGEVDHPMEEDHFIEWIELSVDGVSQKKFLNPGSAPEADFFAPEGSASARIYCNLHGLWTNS